MENEYSEGNSFKNLAGRLDRPVAIDDLPEREESQFRKRQRASSLRNHNFHEEREEYIKIIKSSNQNDDDDPKKEKEEAKHLSELFSNIDDFIEAVQSRDTSTKTKQSTTTRLSDKETASASCPVIADSEIAAESSVSTKRIILHQPIDADAFGRMEPLQMVQHERFLSNSPMTAFSSSVGIVSRREDEDDKKASANDTKESKVHRQRRRITFPQQLHAMLETAQENGHDDIISWQKHGRAFMVKDKERFVTAILPNYFHQTQYRSFQRQLALYGFIRYTNANSVDFGSYYHPNFLKGCPSLCHMILRTAIKGTNAAAATKGSIPVSQLSDPDFSSNVPTEEYDDDAGHNDIKSSYREAIEQNTIDPLDMSPSISQVNPRNSPQRKSVGIHKITASIQGNHQRTIVINGSIHDSNMKNDDCYYDNECDDYDIDNASMAEFLSDVDL